MGLSPGAWLGTYEILGHIGSGGMGEVYRARDNKLNREVAVKVLPEQFARDPERVARFRREAQLLAQINHPNIAAIYTVEESGDHHFLVMELVPGETLRERIKRGPVAVEEALAISKQIAEALEHAHEKPIIHRDLKPANVKVTPEGKVKVLDFGLAKAFAKADQPADPADIPTGSQHGTLAGTILGTPAYMSPEQANGKATDKRTDIWALGCVLYELLTGKRAFEGETVTEILAGVLRGEPDWQALPSATPPSIHNLLRRCLQKDPQHRLRDAADIAIQIEDAQATPVTPTAAKAAAPPPLWRRAMPFVLTGLAAAAITAGMTIWNRPAPAPPQVSRTLISLPPDVGLQQDSAIALSPDGTQLVFDTIDNAGTRQLYLRAMDSLVSRPIAGTDGGFAPFFSPDGQWIGFLAAGKLKKVSVTGGAPLTLADAVAGGGSWGPDGTIIYNPVRTEGLWQISAAGGTPHPLTKLQEGEIRHSDPHFLPDGKSVLFTSRVTPRLEDRQISLLRLDTGERKALIRAGDNAQYVPTGHLVYFGAGGTLMAVPFDLVRLEAGAAPVPVLEGVADPDSFSFSNDGTLVYVPGRPDRDENDRTLVWVNRTGRVEPVGAPPRRYALGQISPDGRQVALIHEDQGVGGDVWIYDLARGTLTRLTFEGNNSSPIWTPDGKRVVYRSQRAGVRNLFWKAADGTGSEEQLTRRDDNRLNSPTSVSPDGKFLIYSDNSRDTKRDIWVLPLEGDRKPSPFLQSPFEEHVGKISPDGRWLAYLSDESGRFEVYVRPFPPSSGRWQISTEGGAEPLWSRNGRELFYRAGGKMMAVDVSTGPSFQASTPRQLFEGNFAVRVGGNSINTDYDVSPDGQRFLMVQERDEQVEGSPSQINVVLNWFEELKRRVPAAR